MKVNDCSDLVIHIQDISSPNLYPPCYHHEKSLKIYNIGFRPAMRVLGQSQRWMADEERRSLLCVCLHHRLLWTQPKLFRGKSDNTVTCWNSPLTHVTLSSPAGCSSRPDAETDGRVGAVASSHSSRERRCHRQSVWLLIDLPWTLYRCPSVPGPAHHRGTFIITLYEYPQQSGWPVVKYFSDQSSLCHLQTHVSIFF